MGKPIESQLVIIYNNFPVAGSRKDVEKPKQIKSITT